MKSNTQQLLGILAKINYSKNNKQKDQTASALNKVQFTIKNYQEYKGQEM
jgi:hypothetical protein